MNRATCSLACNYDLKLISWTNVNFFRFKIKYRENVSIDIFKIRNAVVLGAEYIRLLNLQILRKIFIT